MKKLLIALLLFAYGTTFAIQDDKVDEYSFEETELQTENPPYFAIAGGATFTFHFANFDVINNRLKNWGMGEAKFSGQVSLWGGEGFTGVVYIPNMRAGFFSYGGGASLTKVFPADDTPEFERNIEYKVGLTGLSLEYAFVPIKAFAIVGGVSLGVGDLTINSYDTPTADPKWDDYSPFSGLHNSVNVASSNYWLVKPTINFEYALANFLMIRAGVSYNMTFGYDWKQNYSANLQNVPSDLNANALQIQAGIFLGLFNY